MLCVMFGLACVVVCALRLYVLPCCCGFVLCAPLCILLLSFFLRALCWFVWALVRGCCVLVCVLCVFICSFMCAGLFCVLVFGRGEGCRCV